MTATRLHREGHRIAALSDIVQEHRGTKGETRSLSEGGVKGGEDKGLTSAASVDERNQKSMSAGDYP